jgi:hypothetical protein
MLQKFIRASFVASLLCTTAGALSIAAFTPAQAEEKVSKEVGEPLNAALQAVQKSDWAAAMASLKQAQAVPNRSPYDDYVINKVLSLVAFNLKDYKTALAAVEAALASPSLVPEDKRDMLTNAFRLESQANNYAGIIQYGKQLEAIRPLDPEELTNVAIALYNTKDTAAAQQYAQKAVDSAKAAGRQPPQAALEITMNAQAKANPEAAEQTLEQIVMQSNSPADWGQLINVSFGTKGMNDAIAMDLYRLSYVTHALKPSEAGLAGKLANQLRYYGDAVSILQSAGVTGADLNSAKANSAKEQGSLNAEIAAARKGSGQTALSVAEALYGYGRFADAEALAREASSKGGTKNPGQAQMLLGMSLARQDKFAEAHQAFGAVSGNPAMTKVAHLWGIYAQIKTGGGPKPAASPPPASH